MEQRAADYLAVVVEGFEDGALARILDRAERESVAAGLRPLIVSRGIDLWAVRCRGLPVELLVDDQRRRAIGLDLPWTLRLESQIRGLVRLWRPITVASFAQPAAPELVARLRQAISEQRRSS